MTSSGPPEGAVHLRSGPHPDQHAVWIFDHPVRVRAVLDPKGGSRGTLEAFFLDRFRRKNEAEKRGDPFLLPLTHSPHPPMSDGALGPKVPCRGADNHFDASTAGAGRNVTDFMIHGFPLFFAFRPTSCPPLSSGPLPWIPEFGPCRENLLGPARPENQRCAQRPQESRCRERKAASGAGRRGLLSKRQR